MSHEQLDVVCIGTMTLVGLSFCIIAFRADQEVNSDCSSTMVRYGWTILQNLGMAVATLGLFYFACNSWVTGGNCYTDESKMLISHKQTVYIILFFILGVLILVVSALILSDRNKMTDEEKLNCGNSSASDKYPIVVMSLASIMCAIPLGLFIWNMVF